MGLVVKGEANSTQVPSGRRTDLVKSQVPCVLGPDSPGELDASCNTATRTGLKGWVPLDQLSNTGC